MADSVRRHMREANMELNPEAVTVIPLEGDGKVSDRVDRCVYGHALASVKTLKTTKRA